MDKNTQVTNIDKRAQKKVGDSQKPPIHDKTVAGAASGDNKKRQNFMNDDQQLDGDDINEWMLFIK